MVAYSGNDIPLLVPTSNGPTARTVNATWAFTALDANGTDVGFSCVS